MARSVMLMVVAFGLLVLAGPVPGQEKPRKEEKKKGLQAGTPAPFIVADFVAGQHAGKPGCPFVMVHNSKSSGVVILAREKAGFTRAIELAKSLDGKVVNADQHRGFLIAYDVDRDKVSGSTKEARLDQFGIGVPRGGRQSGEKAFRDLGLADKVDLVITVVAGETIKGIWLLSGPNELKERRAMILGEVETMIKGPPSEAKPKE